MIMKCGRGLDESVQQTQGSIMRIYDDIHMMTIMMMLMMMGIYCGYVIYMPLNHTDD